MEERNKKVLGSILYRESSVDSVETSQVFKVLLNGFKRETKCTQKRGYLQKFEALHSCDGKTLSDYDRVCPHMYYQRK